MEEKEQAYILAEGGKAYGKPNGNNFDRGNLVIVLLIGLVKSRAEFIINFVLRGVTGMLIIYFVNFLLAEKIPSLCMGYNLVTFLASGVLGLPGVALLYGVNLYMNW